jgi:hypothetical protein
VAGAFGGVVAGDGSVNKATCLAALQNQVKAFNQAVAAEQGDWIVKGFIDISAGPFAASGVEVFDDYWQFYLTVDMAVQSTLGCV